jgi:hypothetical protein
MFYGGISAFVRKICGKVCKTCQDSWNPDQELSPGLFVYEVGYR